MATCGIGDRGRSLSARGRLGDSVDAVAALCESRGCALCRPNADCEVGLGDEITAIQCRPHSEL